LRDAADVEPHKLAGHRINFFAFVSLQVKLLLLNTPNGTLYYQMKEEKPKAIHPGVRIGHVHLKVADLERAIAFYRDILGFELTQRYGRQAAFLSAGGYHHHIGLNTWESHGGSPPHRGATGLYHLAIVYPTRAELADALRRLVRAGVPLDGASDHGVSEALYLRDPDGNGVELYWDRPKEQWPKTSSGELNMVTEPLDIEALLPEAPEG
jgi:catechol 2,3-dioxygenase